MTADYPDAPDTVAMAVAVHRYIDSQVATGVLPTLGQVVEALAAEGIDEAFTVSVLSASPSSSTAWPPPRGRGRATA